MSENAVLWEELTLDDALELAEKRGIIIVPVATRRMVIICHWALIPIRQNG